jgi:hypothetical protein
MSVITDKNGNVIEEIAQDVADNEPKTQEIAPESDREQEKGAPVERLDESVT